ncbi:MAG: RNA methyltransferase, partial [Candidatus Cloacimonetes bacterium]|nr:RNA methyltransferase [Candidatus Cloacimonadota bacterium]
ISFATNLEKTINEIKNQEGNDPIIITTTANYRKDQISFVETKKLLKTETKPVLLLFGTGNGLHEDIHSQADFVLVPIQARTDYNHLSVRSAVAIVLDRLLSEEYKEEL